MRRVTQPTAAKAEPQGRYYLGLVRSSAVEPLETTGIRSHCGSLQRPWADNGMVSYFHRNDYLRKAAVGGEEQTQPMAVQSSRVFLGDDTARGIHTGTKP